MPRVTLLLVCTLLGLVALATSAALHPQPVLAAPGILQFDVSLQDGPQDTANSLSWLTAGTEVFVTGEAVTGYYPVTVGVLTGWVLASALVLEAQSPVPAVDPAATLVAAWPPQNRYQQKCPRLSRSSIPMRRLSPCPIRARGAGGGDG